MNRPALEVADIFRSFGARFVERSRARISWPQHKVMRAIERCRTAALGRHRDHCLDCGQDLGLSFNSCRNRHCPKCQTAARNRWVAARTRELVPSNYFHIVFTVPHQLSPLMLQNKRLLYNLLFRCASATLMEVAANPKWLGAEAGFLCILHTWGQTLTHHPHLHCVVPAGGFASGRQRWVWPKSAKFFAPKDVLAEVFRGKFYDGLKLLFRRRQLVFHGSLAWLAEPHAFAQFLHLLHRHTWIVDVRKPFGGPEHVLHYLARYTHRVAISNHRLIGMEDGNVTFRWKDYAHGGKKRKMALAAEEFIRRFLLHVLPKGLVRIRYYGWMANRLQRECAAQCRALLAAVEPPTTEQRPGRRCPRCGGAVETVEVIVPRELRRRPAAGNMSRTARNDTLLLTSHAGRSARMLDVCRHRPAFSIGGIRASQAALCTATSALAPDARSSGHTTQFARRRYQTTIESAYGLLPRPPQTPAARFKRLYRK